MFDWFFGCCEDSPKTTATISAALFLAGVYCSGGTTLIPAVAAKMAAVAGAIGLISQGSYEASKSYRNTLAQPQVVSNSNEESIQDKLSETQQMAFSLFTCVDEQLQHRNTEENELNELKKTQ